ncbi:MAG: hypothetical protein H5T71_08265, partial [Chloroflexi bacterium]|nr:hypothetical protein [Chloroflexota bacterium]
MEAGHRVPEVGHVPRPALEGLLCFLVRGRGVADRRDGADPPDLGGEVERAGELGGERDDLDLVLEPGREPPERVAARWEEPAAIEGARLFRIQERALEVDPQDPGDSRHGGHR